MTATSETIKLVAHGAGELLSNLVEQRLCLVVGAAWRLVFDDRRHVASDAVPPP